MRDSVFTTSTQRGELGVHKLGEWGALMRPPIPGNDGGPRPPIERPPEKKKHVAQRDPAPASRGPGDMLLLGKALSSRALPN